MHCAQRVQCGDHFTVAASTDNELLFWGRRCKLPADSPGVTMATCPLPTADSGNQSDGCGGQVSSREDPCSPSELKIQQFKGKTHSLQASSTSVSSILDPSVTASKDSG